MLYQTINDDIVILVSIWMKRNWKKILYCLGNLKLIEVKVKAGSEDRKIRR